VQVASVHEIEEADPTDGGRGAGLELRPALLEAGAALRQQILDAGGACANWFLYRVGALTLQATFGNSTII
jgi:hypothetical protein